MSIEEFRGWVAYFKVKGDYEKHCEQRRKHKLPIDGFFGSHHDRRRTR